MDAPRLNDGAAVVDRERTTTEAKKERTMAMLNPCHPGEILRDNLEAAELSVTDAAARLGCTRQALSRLLNGKAGSRRRWRRRWRVSGGATRAYGCAFRRPTNWPRSGAGKRPEHMTTDDLRDELASLFEAAANVGLHVFASYIA